MNSKRISIVIPCLNEEGGLKKILPQISNISTEIIIVDGNSTDNSTKIAEKFNTKIITENNKGYGQALMTGFNNSQGEIMVNFDGDATYPTKSIQSMYEYYKKNKVDFLTACRFPLKNKNSMQTKNFFGNLLISSITSLLLNFQVTDICSGMWMMDQKTWNKLKKETKNKKWFFSNEIKIQAVLDPSILYGEFPIELNVRHGKSKVNNVWIIGLQVILQTIKKIIINTIKENFVKLQT